MERVNFFMFFSSIKCNFGSVSVTALHIRPEHARELGDELRFDRIYIKLQQYRAVPRPKAPRVARGFALSYGSTWINLSPWRQHRDAIGQTDHRGIDYGCIPTRLGLC